MLELQSRDQRERSSSGKAIVSAEDIIARLDGATPTFVLIDPLLGEPLPGVDFGLSGADAQAAREDCWDREVIQIQLSDRISLPLSQHPYLVGLEGSADPILELTLELAQAEQEKACSDELEGKGMAAHRIGGWLQSSMHSRQLAETIAVMCNVNTEAYTLARYLRLADRRALALLRHVVGESRIRGMLGRIQRWSYLDAMGEIATLNGMEMGIDSTPVRLSLAEWHHMELGEVIHRTLAQYLGELGRSGLGPALHCTAANLYDPATNAVEVARQAARTWPHRFLEPSDQTTYATLALLYPALADSPAVQSLLQQAGSSDEPATPLRYLHARVRALLSPE